MGPRREVVQRVRGLYGLADAAASGGDPVGLGADLLAGGCRLVQLRCKDWPADEVLRAARQLVDRCRGVGATLIVNDDPEIAVAADADGVHVGQTDGSGEAIRRILGPDRILGRSTHRGLDLAGAQAHADYLAFGPVFATPHLSRPKEVRGLDALMQIRGAVPARVPVVAIGGITPQRLPEVRACGIDTWAVIGAVAHAADRIAATRLLLG